MCVPATRAFPPSLHPHAPTAPLTRAHTIGPMRSPQGEGSDERCENGEGAACERLAEGNELIMKLQEKSRANKEKNARAQYDKTVRMLQYGDYFDAMDKNLVQMPNGKYTTLDMQTYWKLRKEGRIDPGSIDRIDFNVREDS